MVKVAPTEVLIYLTGVASVVLPGAFGAFGAIVYYLYISATQQVNPYEGKLFSFTIMGFFVGTFVDMLMTEFLDKSYLGLVLISGFLFLRILALVSSDKFAEWVLVKVGVKDKN